MLINTWFCAHFRWRREEMLWSPAWWNTLVRRRPPTFTMKKRYVENFSQYVHRVKESIVIVLWNPSLPLYLVASRSTWSVREDSAKGKWKIMQKNILWCVTHSRKNVENRLKKTEVDFFIIIIILGHFGDTIDSVVSLSSCLTNLC